MVAVLAGLLQTGCDKDTPVTTSGGGGSASASAPPPTTPPPPATGEKSTDYCVVAERIGTQSGIMVNKHFVSPLKETREMLEGVVTLSLAAQDELIAGLPDNIRAALREELRYFQMLKDSNYTASPPAGFEAANKIVNDYGVATCGFVFDK
jgi:hypothetical protein